MADRLADAVSPYLRSHAGNPVDWWPWGEAAFAAARERDVPVLISIGYATCHWCHVMARESFSDPDIAALLNERMVAIKVDREEHPDVDAAYLAAASAFTRDLGWPLTVFATPDGAAYFAATYLPPRPVGEVPSFRMVVDAVLEAWHDRRGDVLAAAGAVRAAVTAAVAHAPGALPGEPELAAAFAALAAQEDAEHGGFGGAPKFPVAPVLRFLLGRPDAAARAVAARALDGMARGGLRDPVEGGFFRYATRADWSVPHYERMLTDNAQLLDVAVAAGRADLAVGVADFLLDVLRLPSGAFASAQDSESTVAGARSEGGYFALDAAARAAETPPALDEKVIAGWNGLAIGALADAGARLGRPEWVDAARAGADVVLTLHLRDGTLRRASRDGMLSDAVATLEDHGLLAAGLLRLALAAGEPRYAVIARQLVESCAADGGGVAAPGGADPVLARRGLALDADLGEGASPSGLSALADAALRLHAISGDARHRAIAEAALAPLAAPALAAPVSFGAALVAIDAAARAPRQLVVVGDDDGLAAAAWAGGVATTAVVDADGAAAFTAAGFELFEGRELRGGRAAAFLCEGFTCRLPVTDADALREQLSA